MTRSLIPTSALVCLLSNSPLAHAQTCESFELEIDCDFDPQSGDYDARLSGRLRPSEVAGFYGSLELITRRPGVEHTQTIQVSGSSYNGGLSGEGRTSAGEVVNLSLSTSAGVVSSVDLGANRYYAVCQPAGVPQAPQGSDLQQSGFAAFQPNADRQTFTLRFPISNYGDTDQYIGGSDWLIGIRESALQPFTRFHASRLIDEDRGNVETDHIRAPGFVIAEVQIPGDVFQRCATIELQIDPEHVLQTSQLNPFQDDIITQPTPCLTWKTMLTADALGTLDVYDNFPAPGQPGGDIRNYIEYVSISDFVSSQVVVRPDGWVCSYCHYERAPNPYHPPVSQYAITVPRIEPSTDLGGRSWDTVDDGAGLALQFLAAPKPLYLRLIMERWIRDGMRPGWDGRVPELREKK